MKVWLYQATPEVYNLEEKVPELMGKHKHDDWHTTRYRDKMEVGDTVVFWQAGAKAGIYALGELLGKPYSKKAAASRKSEWWVDISYTRLLERPILKTDLVNHPILQDLSVLSLSFRVRSRNMAAIA
jgi:predicted RNA-binding protein with PUA-like domain